MRWRWPPDSLTPRSPTGVAYPTGRAAMNSWAWAIRAATLDVRLARAGLAIADVVADGVGEEKGFLRDDAHEGAQRSDGQIADIVTIQEDPARLDIVKARHEVHQRGLAAPDMPTKATISPLATVSEMSASVSSGAFGVPERDVLEGEGCPRKPAMDVARGRS